MPTPTAVLTAAAVRAEMARRTPRMTQLELAALLGKSAATISARMNGITPFRVAELVEIAQHLDIPLWRLLPDEGARDRDGAAS